MLVDNGKKLIKVSGTYEGTVLNLKDWNNNTISSFSVVAFRNAVHNPYYPGVNNSSSFVLLGDDNTAEDLSQYNIIGNNISQNFTRVGYVLDANHIVGLSTTFRNDTNNTYTIRELGYFIWSGYSSSSSIMISRKVFDTPIIMEPGDSRTFEIQIDINV